ncbi:MAG: hypothetical protein NW223_09780 [Hyphomicrobiaceae bacterium]|nr:hypothetical protein [Hyphomicrobiaceae bacterium]
MPTTLPKKPPVASRHPRTRPDHENDWLGASLLVALVLSALTLVLPPGLVLPALSGVLIVSGLALGACAPVLERSPGGARERMRDMAGVLVLFGFATAIICDKTEALRLLSAPWEH